MVDDTQMTVEGNKRNRSLSIAAAVVGSVAAGGGAAFALNKFLQGENEGQAQRPGDGQEGDQNPGTEPHGTGTVEVHNHVTVEKHAAKPAPAEPAKPGEGEVEILGTEQYELPDGTEVTVGYMRIDGKLAMVVDTDNDGVFDYVCYDENGDGDLQANEIQELPTEGASAMHVVSFMEAAGEDPSDWIEAHYHTVPDDHFDEEPVQLVGMTEVVDSEGNPMTMAGVTVDGEEVMLVDVDHDGKFDIMAHDDNGDGVIQENEMHEIEGDIRVDDVANLPQNPNYANNDAYADNTSTESWPEPDDKDSVSIDEQDDNIVPASQREDEPIAEEPDDTDDSIAYEEPDPVDDSLTTEDDFGTFGDEGINC